MNVKRDNLLVIAGIVWIIAGINISFIGLNTYPGTFAFAWWIVGLLFLGTIIVVCLFHVMFGKMVQKHVRRIHAFQEERVSAFRFFDVKSYLIMAFMIALGVTLRVSGIVPDWFIAFFYTGLGSALIVAGAGFLLHRKHGFGWSFHGSRRGSRVSSQL